MTNDKIPKGFIVDCDIVCPIHMVNLKGENKFYLEKSIYDKRMMLITKYVLKKERRLWLVSDTNHIQKIINGGGDGKE